MPYAVGTAYGAALLLLLTFYFDFTLEDAHITFRYAKHLAEGSGFGIWNVGEDPVEGFTSFLWMVVIATAIWLGFSAFTAAKVFGSLSLVSIILLCLAAWRNHRRDALSQPNDFLLLAAVLFSIYLPFAWYAVSGMEAVSFAALTTALLLTSMLFTRPWYRSAFAQVISVLMVLTRPEGVLLATLINGYDLTLERSGRRKSASAILPMLATWLTFALLTMFRYHHFGDPLPNTYYAKGRGGISHAEHGVIYVGLFFVFTSPMWIAAIRGLPRAWANLRQQGLALFLAGVLAIYCLYLIKVGGDPDSAFPMWRQFVQIAPIWVFFIALMIELGFPTRRSQLQVATFAVAACNLLIVGSYYNWTVREPFHDIAHYGLFARERPNPYFVWLSQLADRSTTTAAALAGQWGWYIPGQQIDMLGLNNRHIAHFGKSASNGAVDSTTDMNYVLERKPDMIDGYLSGNSLLKGVCPYQMSGFRSETLLTMVNNPIFRDEYEFVRNAPYRDLDRAVFIRRDYLARWPNAHVDAVPVGETVLYQGQCVPRDSSAVR